jgi:hypothetical protein
MCAPFPRDRVLDGRFQRVTGSRRRIAVVVEALGEIAVPGL